MEHTTATRRFPHISGKHGFEAPLPFLPKTRMKTFSIGVFEIQPSKFGFKKGKAKVRVMGLTSDYAAVLAKAHEVADQLDEGLYTGGKTVKVDSGRSKP